MRITTIIPTRDEQENIGPLLESVFAHAPDEVLVVDGGSTDRTGEIVENSRARLLVETGGVVRQLNEAASEASGEVLFFLHADSRLGFAPEPAIREALAGADAVGGGFQLDYGPGVVWQTLAWGANARGRRMGLPMGDQGLFCTKAVFERVGGFRSEPLLPDLDLMRRAATHGRIVLRPERLTSSPRRYQDNGVLRNLLLNQVLMIADARSPERAPQWAVKLLAWLRRR